MTKLLKLLSLTTILSGTSALALAPANINETETIKQESSTVAVIDNLDMEMFAEVITGSDFNADIRHLDAILNISWEEANNIKGAEVTNLFTTSLPRGKTVTDKLMLERKESTHPDQIKVTGGIFDIDLDTGLYSTDITVIVNIWKIANDPTSVEASIDFEVYAASYDETQGCSASAIIDKITFFK